MKKENHDFEVRASRALGFGGSDAAMVLAIGKKISEGQPLTTTMKRRLRILKGLDPIPEPLSTPETEAGHAFEDEVADKLSKNGFSYEREALLELDTQYGFKIFAHADFWQSRTETVVECKWTRSMSFEQLKQTYMPQLQWYYMIGVKQVVLLGCVDVEGMRVNHKEIIPMDHTIIDALEYSLRLIDEELDDIVLVINEASDEELPKEVRYAVEEMEELKKAIASKEERYKEVSEWLMEWMKDNNITKVNNLDAHVTYTPAGSSSRFDSAGLKKAYPKIWEMFNKSLQKKEYITFKVREEAKNDN